MKFSEYRMLNCVATGIICAFMLSGCGGYGKGGVSGEGIKASPAPTSGAEDVTVPELTPGVETASSLTPTAVPYSDVSGGRGDDRRAFTYPGREWELGDSDGCI